ncbi:hypothetical protein HDU76_013642 [Blyttiomyces sp. JEL0837]|nr:hypothetical protein HDU76_013642 [Blyttiomyces sp. JEL0837]
MSDLTTLRGRVDVLDSEIVKLLNERAQVAINIGVSKRKNAEEQGNGSVEDLAKAHVHIPEREQQVYERLKRINHGPLTNEAVEAIYREIMSASISLQKDVVIAFLGPRGSYTHTAASLKFGDSVAYADQTTIKDIFIAVESGAATYGVVPFENSTHGSVTQTLDGFLKSQKLMIRAEMYMPIHHCLMSRFPKESITKIYSHPEAFGQVAQYLQTNFKGVERVNVSSTSYAAELCAKEPNSAAVCNVVCAQMYGLNILAENIEDLKNNTTRFFVIGDKSEGPTKKDKTLLYFTLDHRQPGALCDALSVLKSKGINLTKIDSRPRGDIPWHYFFIVEMTGHIEDNNIKEALKEMQPYCLNIKTLGSYMDEQIKLTGVCMHNLSEPAAFAQPTASTSNALQQLKRAEISAAQGLAFRIFEGRSLSAKLKQFNTRGITSSAHFHPISVIDSSRLPLNRRSFPEWRKNSFNGAITVADRQRINKNKPRSQHRLKGWSNLTHVLADKSNGLSRRLSPVEQSISNLNARLYTIYSEHPDDFERQIVEIFEMLYQDTKSNESVKHSSLFPLSIAAVMRFCSKYGKYEMLQTLVERYLGWVETGNLSQVDKKLVCLPVDCAIEILCLRGNTNAGVKVLERMNAAGFEVQGRCLHYIMMAYSESDMEKAVSILKVLVSQKENIPLSVLNRLLKSSMQSTNKQASARFIFETLLSQHRPNSDTAVTLISYASTPAAIQNLSREAESWKVLSNSEVQVAWIMGYNRVYSREILGLFEFIDRLTSLGIPLSYNAISLLASRSVGGKSPVDLTKKVLSNVRTVRNVAPKTYCKIIRLLRDSSSNHKEGVRLAWEILYRISASSNAPSPQKFCEVIEVFACLGEQIAVEFLRQVYERSANITTTLPIRFGEDEIIQLGKILIKDNSDVQKAFDKAYDIMGNGNSIQITAGSL